VKEESSLGLVTFSDVWRVYNDDWLVHNPFAIDAIDLNDAPFGASPDSG